MINYYTDTPLSALDKEILSISRQRINSRLRKDVSFSYVCDELIQEGEGDKIIDIQESLFLLEQRGFINVIDRGTFGVICAFTLNK